jgi:thiosulfate/3-mercaptopyruvate sulfurtransferase
MIGMMQRQLNRRKAIGLGIAAAASVLGYRGVGAQGTPEPDIPAFPGNVDPPLLVSPEWLQQTIDSGETQLVILDLGEWSDYRDGHIPGAIHSYWQETIERDSLVYGTVLGNPPHQAERQAWLRRYGIGPDTHVIAYDHGDGRRAARVLWLLRFFGHESSSVLDGGINSWKSANLPISTDGSDPQALSQDPVVEPQDNFFVDTRKLKIAMRDENTVLLDIRSDDERHDTIDGQYPLGLIQDSIWTPWTDYIADDHGRFIDPAEAQAKLTAAGVTPDRRVILYGRFGTDPDQMWLLLRLLGYPSVETYDWGWVSWGTDGSTKKDLLPST